MVAADTSSFVAYFTGEKGEDVERLAAALAAGQVILPPIVLAELLSDPAAAETIEPEVTSLASVPVDQGYWARAGALRRKLAQKRLKARTANALIAQFCLDNDLALITRDRDFRHFAAHCGLRLA
jgi:predicted nucleic acid-binding protein